MGRDKAAKEDAELLAADKKAQEEESKKPKTKITVEVDTGVLDAFSYFDRVPGYTKMLGKLPRLKIENLLLCVDEDLTIHEISEMLDVPQIPAKEVLVPYKPIAAAEKTVVVE